MATLDDNLTIRISGDLKRRLYDRARNERRSANFKAIQYIEAGIISDEKEEKKRKK